MEEADLIRAGQRGDVAAFNRLVLLYQELVYNVCYRTLGNPDGAADVTQDTFSSAFRALKGYRGGSFKAWLLRIATNGCYDLLRRQKRQQAASLDEIVAAGEADAALVAREGDPEAQAMRRELIEYLQACIMGLPPEQRIVLVLSDVQGSSYEEICEATQVNIGTVKSRLSRARGHMRNFLLRHRELLPVAPRHD